MIIEDFDIKRFERKRMWLALIPAMILIIFVWLSYIIQISGVFERNLTQLGILPREFSGLKGILFSPLIHSSIKHLWSNTLPLIILTWFLFYFYSKISYYTFILLWLLSGLITWLIGRGSYHIGASGLVFSLLFFLFFSGLFRKYIPLIAVSLVVVFIYGGTVWSMFPITEYIDSTISWEGHLSGAISGLIIATLFRNQGPQRPVKVWDNDNENNNDEEDYDYMSDEYVDWQVKARLKIDENSK